VVTWITFDDPCQSCRLSVILKVSAGSFYGLHLVPVISLSILFSRTFVMCSFRIVITQVSHCYRRTDEVIQDDQKVSVHLMITVQKQANIL
jgi:hypothetical protein